VFGISEKTAIRYAAAARQVLTTSIEQPTRVCEDDDP
jgi:hypothetical protein